MNILQRLLFVGLFLPSLVHAMPRVEQEEGERCAAYLNALATKLFQRDFDFRWLGARRSKEAYSWSHFTFPVFDVFFDRARVPQHLIDRMKDMLNYLRLSQAEIDVSDRDHPAILTSRATSAFFDLFDAERPLFGAFVPMDVGRQFPFEAKTFYLYEMGNFDFAREHEWGAMGAEAAFGHSLELPAEALLFRLPNSQVTEAALRYYVADMLADLTRRREIDSISAALRRAKPEDFPVWAEQVTVGDDGRIKLGEPYFRVYLESRAHAVRAWALHRLMDLNWNNLYPENQERALQIAEWFSSPEAVEPYRHYENGVYRDLTVPLARALRGKH